jgi:hypothetical protein
VSFELNFFFSFEVLSSFVILGVSLERTKEKKYFQNELKRQITRLFKENKDLHSHDKLIVGQIDEHVAKQAASAATYE